ncbi:basic secretory protease [Phtheirospermum japonicum]|uniref:Basic secretory protease n=1 Tax=Phtheirospermum japonicum TaxID=374723 RepID=A0A830BEM2_9LAMI|nr:basic secretory protease [Phtheirospermum japonicum]
MKTINCVIWDIFQQYNETDQKDVETVKVFIHQYNGAEAVTYGNNINGEGKAPVGLIEGVADYTILKSNYYPPGFAKRGQGERWDQGYDFTARFLEYCEELKSGFVAGLNKKMRHDFSESYFEELTGKPLGQLWADYKAKYRFDG